MCQYVAYAKWIISTNHRRTDGTPLDGRHGISGLCDGSSWPSGEVRFYSKVCWFDVELPTLAKEEVCILTLFREPRTILVSAENAHTWRLIICVNITGFQKVSHQINELVDLQPEEAIFRDMYRNFIWGKHLTLTWRGRRFQNKWWGGCGWSLNCKIGKLDKLLR